MESDARLQSIHEHTKENYDTFKMTLKKGCKELVYAYAEAEGKTVSKFIKDCVNEHIGKMIFK